VVLLSAPIVYGFSDLACEAVTLKHLVPGTCEAGGSIKPGAQAPGSILKTVIEPAKRAAAADVLPLSPISWACAN
jgi:hypothetical protein